jgi:hypothetical protein
MQTNKLLRKNSSQSLLMSGTRRIIASKIELLADEPLIGPTSTDTVLSAPTVTKLGNNPSLFVFNMSNVILPTSGPTTLPVTLLYGNTRYFNAYNTNSPYHSRLTPSINAQKARLSDSQGLGLKGVLVFEGYAIYTGALASPMEVSIGIHGEDNLGNTWDKTNVVLFSPAAGAAGKSFSMSLPLTIPYLATRSRIDFYFTSDNPSGVNLSLGQLQGSFDVQQ